MQRTRRNAWGVKLAIVVCVTVGMISAFAARQAWSADQDERAKAAAEEKKKADKKKADDIQAQMKAAMERYEAEQKAVEEQRRNDPTWKPSHEELSVIHVGRRGEMLRTFCLRADGNVLAGCGGQQAITVVRDGKPETKMTGEPGEVRVFTREGKLVEKWPVKTAPQVICVGSDGKVYVGGEGLLLKLDATGKLLEEAELPSLAEEKTDEKKSDEKDKADDKKKEGPEQAYAARLRREVFGIAVTRNDVFAVCLSRKGFQLSVWRMGHDFKNPKEIIQGLVGCCGQMDIQARGKEVWIPENGRHRVLCYDREGKQLSSFGKNDRKAADGFGGCCEPKNIRLLPGGDILTAESQDPLAIKRFSAEGKFLGVVAMPKFTNGCTRVCVDADRDGRVFVLDTGDSAIHVFADKRDQPSHKLASTIRLAETGELMPVPGFGLNNDGNLVVAYYHQADAPAKNVGEIRVLDTKGKVLDTWKLEFSPQMINVAQDGTVYVAGAGKIARLDKSGKPIQTVDLPTDAKPVTEDKEAEAARKAKIAELTPKMQKLSEEMRPITTEMTKIQVELNKIRAEVGKPEADKEKLEADIKRLEADRTKKAEQLQALQKDLQPVSRQLAELRQVDIEKLAAARRTVTGIAAGDRDVFVACSATKSFGIEVWRMDRDFANPKRIVGELRGCCGNMDVQTHAGDLFVAENVLKRVVRYDREGKQIASWGSTDRKSLEGFGSCCNPMNTCFDAGGNLYTSEAVVGRIKKYTADGKLLGLVGTVDVAAGCTRVTVAATPDGKRIFLLDGPQIRVLEQQNEGKAEKKETAMSNSEK
jgi:sugar lactone lactonase YvrE